MVNESKDVRVRVYHDDGTYEDLSHRLTDGPVISADKDSDDWSCSMTFDNRDQFIRQNLSLDPYDESSTLNQNGSSNYDPLLARFHKIKVWRKDMGDASWSLVYEGFCGSGDIRTWVQVVYRDRNSGAEKAIDPQTDDTAKGKYGIWKGDGNRHHRKMRIVEDQNSLIDTEAEAIDFAQYALDDLTKAEPEISTTYTGVKGEVQLDPFGRSQAYKLDNRMDKYKYTGRDLTQRTGTDTLSLLESILLDSGFKNGGDPAKPYKVVIEDDPGFTATAYKTGEETTWESLQNAVSKTGHILAMRYHDSGTSYNDGSGETTPQDGYYLTLYDPQRDKTTPDLTYGDDPGETIANRDVSAGREMSFEIKEDIVESIEPHQLVQMNGPDYNVKIGVSSVEFDFSPSLIRGSTRISGIADTIIGKSDYWLSRELTEEERRARYQDFLQGNTEKLPEPQNVQARSYTTQGKDGTSMANLVVTWKQPQAQGYGHTEVWVAVGKETRFGNRPDAITQNNHVEIKGFPTDKPLYVKVKHVSSAHITPGGQR